MRDVGTGRRQWEGFPGEREGFGAWCTSQLLPLFLDVSAKDIDMAWPQGAALQAVGEECIAAPRELHPSSPW
jgi:hypothetical protein